MIISLLKQVITLVIKPFQAITMCQSYKVWSKFSSKTADGEIVNFRIVDMPEDKFNDVSDLLRRYFAPEEAIFRASGLLESETALKEAEGLLHNMWDGKEHHVAVCCIDDGTENEYNIIGASLMAITTKDDVIEDLKPQTKEMKKFIEITYGLASKFDTIKTYGLDRFYDDRGVVVHPKYRRLGITREFFKVRRQMCKDHGISMTGAWMTSIGSQKAAERDGWETVYEETYKDLENQYSVIFKDTPPTCKYMIGRPE